MTPLRESSHAIEITCLSKTFTAGCRALDGIDLKIRPGEMVALIGSSGSGKSTLLRCLSGLLTCDRQPCTIKVLGSTVQENGLLSRDIYKIRSRIGFIFQQFNLVDRLPVLTNVLAGALTRIPTWRNLLHWFSRSEKELALEALDRVGIAQCAQQRAGTLSGGQQQRAAIARALVQQAEVILADEPIASLDPESSRCVMDLLSEINRKNGITVLVSLHQVDFALSYCPHIIGLKNGKIVYDGPSSKISESLLNEIYKTGSFPNDNTRRSVQEDTAGDLCPGYPKPMVN
jgi:phosphonate transport system ATP-binding protein